MSPHFPSYDEKSQTRQLHLTSLSPEATQASSPCQDLSRASEVEFHCASSRSLGEPFCGPISERVVSLLLHVEHLPLDKVYRTYRRWADVSRTFLFAYHLSIVSRSSPSPAQRQWNQTLHASHLTQSSLTATAVPSSLASTLHWGHNSFASPVFKLSKPCSVPDSWSDATSELAETWLFLFRDLGGIAQNNGGHGTVVGTWSYVSRVKASSCWNLKLESLLSIVVVGFEVRAG